MTHTEELIARLRDTASRGVSSWGDLQQEAADALETLMNAVDAEREACAEVCDELHWPWRMGDNSGPKECASAIRARGQA
jgi:hypothetical protein